MGGTCSGEGNVVPDPPKTNLELTAARIEFQIQDLDGKIESAERDIKHYVAMGAQNSAAKLRAMRLLKMKKMYEQQRANLIGTQFNVEELQAQRNQADVALTAIRAMKASEEQMRKQQQAMPLEMVDELNFDLRQAAEDVQLISASLAESSGALDGSDAAAEEELRALEAEMEEEAQRRAARAEEAGRGGTRGAGGADTAPRPTGQRGAAALARPKGSAARARPLGAT